MKKDLDKKSSILSCVDKIYSHSSMLTLNQTYYDGNIVGFFILPHDRVISRKFNELGVKVHHIPG